MKEILANRTMWKNEWTLAEKLMVPLGYQRLSEKDKDLFLFSQGRAGKRSWDSGIQRTHKWTSSENECVCISYQAWKALFLGRHSGTSHTWTFLCLFAFLVLPFSFLDVINWLTKRARKENMAVETWLLQSFKLKAVMVPNNQTRKVTA